MQLGCRFLAKVMLLALTTISCGSASVQAEPLWPGGPDIPGIPALFPSVDPLVPSGLPPLGPANFATPTLNPGNGEVVGVAQPVIISFSAPIADRAIAEAAIRVTSQPEVPGHFYWFTNSQLRWRPEAFWPTNTTVTVDAGDAHVTFSIGDAVVAISDDATKTITITRNGEVIKTMPTSMGSSKNPTPNGTYIVGERFRDMYMDSSTYGVPVDSPEGYRTYVEYATRISNSGIFVHPAPWSVGSQGRVNVSHGCLNVSTENGKWFFENIQKGVPLIVKNTIGGTLSASDGLGDWN
ncbi:MAG: L,D-transpeptidase [Mycobacteriaceae bacterium]